MRVYTAIWANDKVQSYTTLTGFLRDHPGRDYDTIMYHISRNGRPYKDDEVTIYRGALIRGKKNRKSKR